MWNIIIPAVVGLIGQRRAGNTAKRGQDLANEQAEAQLELQRQAMARLEEQRQRYREFEFFNPYQNLENPFADMENTFEDLTVSQDAARFQMEQGAQQRANILERLSGAAGASGIASLAQSLAQQGTIQARQVSADIARQESMNERLAAQGGARIQQLERQGAFQAEMARRGGDMAVQQAEMQRQATLLGVGFQEAAGAAAGVQGAYANQMQMGMMGAQMQMANNQMMMDFANQIDFNSIFDNMGGAGADQNITQINPTQQPGYVAYNDPNDPSFGMSDRRLKTDIMKIGLSPSGLKIYSFKYIDKSLGEGIWQGVMSDEIPQHAVVKHANGYDMVNYSMLDVEFKQL